MHICKMIGGLHCPEFLSLFQTGNVSYALSLSQELLNHGNSFNLTCPFSLILSVVHKQSLEKTLFTSMNSMACLPDLKPVL